MVAGIGASTKIIVENWNGVPYVKPYARVRDTITFLRAALAGEKVDEEYETFTVKRFQLAAKIEQQPPIVIGAVRPRMLGLSGELGDGAVRDSRLREEDRDPCGRVPVADGRFSWRTELVSASYGRALLSGR